MLSNFAAFLLYIYVIIFNIVILYLYLCTSDQIYMAVFFWYFAKIDFLQGNWNTARPYVTGHPVWNSIHQPLHFAFIEVFVTVHYLEMDFSIFEHIIFWFKSLDPGDFKTNKFFDSYIFCANWFQSLAIPCSRVKKRFFFPNL